MWDELNQLLPLLRRRLAVAGINDFKGFTLQVDGREATKGTGLSEQAIENEIVQRFVLSLMDPGEHRTAYDRWCPGKSSLEGMFGVVDDYCAKALCAAYPAPVEDVLWLEESDSDYEVEVAAFGAPRLSRGNVRGGHFQRMTGGGHRPPAITKDLVYKAVELRSNTGNSGIAARRRVGKRSDRARDHECG